MAALGTHYDDADLKVRSIPDGVLFEVKRNCLVRGSEIFRELLAKSYPFSQQQPV